MDEYDLQNIDFIIYCVETYKERKGLDGKTAYNKLKVAGAINYIDKNYEALHTFSDNNIMWNIAEYINSHNTRS